MKSKLLFCSVRLVFLFFVLGLVSCKENHPEDTSYHFTAAELAEMRANTCFTKDANEGYPLTEAVVHDRAVGAKNRFWEPGETLRVRFLNGNPLFQRKVFSYAKQWEKYANVHFVRVFSGSSEIRVAFDAEGNYSMVGKDNLNVPSSQKTMNLDFNSNTSIDQITRATLHEFGHALGLKHEHQSPLANIPWDKPAVYAFYGAPPNNWSQQQVDAQILNKNSWESSQITIFDAKSIMEYPVQANLTTDGSSIGWNNQLSDTDKDFIGMMYSTQRIRVRHAVSTSGTITFWLNGIYHTLNPGESLYVPAKTTDNQLYIWECPNGNCAWDSYVPPYGYNYKIVAVDNLGDLKLAYD